MEVLACACWRSPSRENVWRAYDASFSEPHLRACRAELQSGQTGERLPAVLQSALRERMAATVAQAARSRGRRRMAVQPGVYPRTHGRAARARAGGNWRDRDLPPPRSRWIGSADARLDHP